MNANPEFPKMEVWSCRQIAFGVLDVVSESGKGGHPPKAQCLDSPQFPVPNVCRV